MPRRFETLLTAAVLPLKWSASLHLPTQLKQNQIWWHGSWKARRSGIRLGRYRASRGLTLRATRRCAVSCSWMSEVDAGW